MAKYFDANNKQDVRLLPSWMREHADVADYAVRMTAEIVAHFTYTDFDGPAYGWELVGASWVQTEGPLEGMVKLTDNLYVSLRGYNVDPALADSFFADAFKREIAESIRWRMMNERRTATVDPDTTEGQAALEPFPSSFPRFLRPFVVEPVTYVI